MEQKTGVNKSIIAIMAVFFIMAGGNAVNPVLQRIIQAFPHVSVPIIRLISTLPSFTAMIVTLIVGATVGKRAPYKTVVTIGIFCYLVGGMGPAFLNTSIPVILVFRAIFGVATGCFSCLNAYILSTVEGPKQAKMIGRGQMVSNFGAATLQMAAGILADIQWNFAFFPYFIAIFSLIMVFILMKEPELPRQAKQEISSASGGGMNKRFIIYAIIQFATMINAMPVMTGMSTLIASRGLGTASTTASILAVCQVGGILTGAVFGKFYALFKRLRYPVAALIQGLGILFILAFNNVILIGVGSVLSGMGTIFLFGLNTTSTGQSVAKRHIPLAISLVTTIGTIGSFISSYYIEMANRLFSNFFNSDVERVFLLGTIVFGVMTVVTLFVNCGAKPVEEEA